MTKQSSEARELALAAKTVQATPNPLTGHTPEEQAQIISLRKACLNAVTEQDIKDIMEVQIEKAKQGDNMSTRFVFERVFGLPMRYKDVQIQVNKTTDIRKVSVDLTNVSDDDLAALKRMRRERVKVRKVEAPELLDDNPGGDGPTV